MEMTLDAYRLSGRVRRSEWLGTILMLLGTLLFSASVCAATTAQKTFASPEDAAAALLQAVKAHDRAGLLGVLGQSSEPWITSGDKTADRAVGERFVAAYETKHGITIEGDKATLVIGDNDYPFAFPIVKSGDRWRFDAEAGREEMLARRIGENELDVIKVMEAIVDAEREYASVDRNGDGVLDYAQKLASTPGKKDGLYWKTEAGAPPSPLGPLVVNATGQGYKKSDKGPTPFHGYYFRMLKGQGKNAASGAFDYVVRGHGIAGFAAVAWPAKYGNSGIMTFIVNQDGKVYEADLGPNTQAKASAMQRFDPGKEWSPVTSK